MTREAHVRGEGGAAAAADEPAAVLDAALAAGLAPVGAPDGEPITARRYDHPHLGGRPVVRLTGHAVAPVEDRLLADLGFSAPEAGDPVASGQRPQPRYPAWALVHDLAHAEVALAAGVEMARAGRLAVPKPGPALERFQAIAATLPDDHLPVYWEEVGRIFLAAGRDKQATMMFGRARTADRQATGPVADPARRRAVFLEFALAGALSAKDIKAYVTELSRRPDPVEAYRELWELAVRRTTGGLAPWPEMLKQIAKLAKAAGREVVTEHRLLLEGLVDAPALWRVADGFWTAQRTLLLPVVAGSVVLKRRLLWRLTAVPRSRMDAWWCALLEETGALDELAGDTGNWLSAMLGRYGDRGAAAPEELLRLVPALADRIREAGTPVRFDAGEPDEYHSIDAVALCRCLEAGVPVADPGPKASLTNWQGPARVDLRSLTDDTRFGPVLARSVPTGGGEFRSLWGTKALRPLLGKTVGARLGQARSGGLEDARTAVRWLGENIRADMLTGIPDLATRIEDLDMVTPLTRTLRAGILDELGWAALDEAAAELKGDSWCWASWPVLVVHDRRKAMAIGPGGRIAEHRLRVPRGADKFDYDVKVFFSDGQFLVCHFVNGRQMHYWSDTPEELFSVRPRLWESLYYEREQLGYTFMAPSGRRFMGHKVLGPGEKRVGPNGQMFHDGRDFWWHATDELDSQVHRVDLATGELTDAELPEFFDPSLLGKDEHWRFDSSWLAPLPYGVTGSPLGSDGRHVGLRVAEDRATGRVRYHRIDGVQGVFDGSGGTAVWGLLDIPGSAKPLVLSGGLRRYDPVVARDAETGEQYWAAQRTNYGYTRHDPSPVAAGTRLMPPSAFWHFLKPRDPAGSAALREVSEDTARRLLKAAATSEEALRTAVAKLLPEVGHPLLIRGVIGCVQEAAATARSHNALLRRLKRVEYPRLKVRERDLGGALEGLLSRYTTGDEGGVAQIELASAFLAGTIGGDSGREQWREYPSAVDWTELPGRIGGLAVRAVSAVTGPAHSRALLRLLRFWAVSPLAEPGLQRGLLKGEEPGAVSGENGSLLPLHSAIRNGSWARSLAVADEELCVFLQRGTVPHPDGVVDIRPVPDGWATPERLQRLVDEAERSGPVPFEPGEADRLADATGLDRGAAALLLAGLPHIEGEGRDFLPTAVRKALDLKVTEAQTGRDRLLRIRPVARLELYDAAMPDDPADLWDQAATADRLARAWKEVAPG
ncbi:hypothetical protein HEK616_78560 (plasmid) [Streptomyces nigrescens]|uniref:DNA-binding protein n=1 Tax=Streptomyces nigrescens TaxID=1920 RepID=A0ABN6R7L8_STRNI|nr:hypothetical protein [Streptomyces nigrescens]BDM74369.1 hypothetical protein HEK616_78560 [Streptomyces nigrescens]